MTLDEIRAFCDMLEAGGAQSFSPRWGITETALIRGAGRPVETIDGSDTDSRLTLYRLPDGDMLWVVHLHGPDDRDGVPWFTRDVILGSSAVIVRAKAIEDWLDQHPQAYDLFVPIRWSAAPDKARDARDWMDAHWTLLESSPLAALYRDLYAELTAAIE